MKNQLLIFETHPVQYHAPVYRYLQTELGVPVTVVYGSDFSVAGYRDAEFGATFSWDTDLLSGYRALFLTRAQPNNSHAPESLTDTGMASSLAQIQPGAVLITGYGFKFHRAAFRLSRQAGYPLLLRAETTDADQHRSALKRLTRDAALRWYYKQFRALLPIGAHSQAHYNRLAPRETPRFFSPYCIALAPFSPGEADRVRLRTAIRQRLALADGQRVLLFSGKLVDKKAPDLLLEAVKRLPVEARQTTTVIFLGDGPLCGALKEAADTAPAVDVRFVGFQNQTALSPYYHAADLLVLPSRYSETWGLVVNEALHHGLPCVVSDRVGCAPDLIINGRTGEIFPHDESLQLAEALLRAAHLIGSASVRQSCREQVANYSVAKAAGGIANAYAHICP